MVEAKTMMEYVRQTDAALLKTFGVQYADVLVDMDDADPVVIRQIAAGEDTVDAYIDRLRDEQGLVDNDPVGNRHRLALIAFARASGWETGADASIYSEFEGVLVRLAVNDVSEGDERQFVLSQAPDYGIDIDNDGVLFIPPEDDFVEVGRGLDIGDTIILFGQDLTPTPEPEPQPFRPGF